MEDKILSLYACGMSQRDIAEQIKSLYDVEISPELVSKISEKIMPEVNAWQNRPLESVYPFIFMDAIHYKVKEDHRYVTKAAYVVLGITMDGRKDILGVWIGEHESSKFWLSVLNDLKSRGVLDVYLFCTDGLCGMMQAIQAVYPKDKLNYIMGNPPFVGARLMEKPQKDDMSLVFGKLKGVGNLDYVSAWYKKAADLIKNTEIRVAFVSTNSITQGEQTAILWKPIMESGIVINFAWRTFKWESQSNDQAAVHCVIVGFSCAPGDKVKKLYAYRLNSANHNIL